MVVRRWVAVWRQNGFAHELAHGGQQGSVLGLLAIFLSVLLLLLAFAADLLRWQVAGHALQSAVDAAALAGAQEVWVRREVDASGKVWSEVTHLNVDEARQKATAVLDQNLSRIQSMVGTLTIVQKEVLPDQVQMKVRVRVVAVPTAYLITRFGLVPPQIERWAEAEPTI